MTRSSRAAVSRARRIVVKIGSSSLARDATIFETLAAQIATLRRQDRQLILVSSGAIAVGVQRLGYRRRPKEMARLQAAAAAGQSILMRRYDEALAPYGIVPAQVLLTHNDLADRKRLNNAREALGALLNVGALPIVNENDTISTEEINFGDNDQLAAMVTPLFQADLLVLLTDVDGVLGPTGKRISQMGEDEELLQLNPTGDKVGTGGIGSKLAAARKGNRAGAHVIVARASGDRTLERIAAGEDVGTLFPAPKRGLKARKHWIAYTLKPRGEILLDPGAVSAVRRGRSSLLPVGVLGVRGDFHRGDAVRLVSADGFEIGRGLTRIGALEVSRAAGKTSQELENLLGPTSAEMVVVHKDDLVVSL